MAKMESNNRIIEIVIKIMDNSIIIPEKDVIIEYKKCIRTNHYRNDFI